MQNAVDLPCGGLLEPHSPCHFSSTLPLQDLMLAMVFGGPLWRVFDCGCALSTPGVKDFAMASISAVISGCCSLRLHGGRLPTSLEFGTLPAASSVERVLQDCLVLARP